MTHTADNDAPRTNGDVWTEHGHPRRPCSPPEAVRGSADCRLASVAPPVECRKCRYMREGKWDGAASVSHAPDCPERTSVTPPEATAP